MSFQNPMTRQNPILARLMAKQTTTDIATSLNTGAHPEVEAKANRIAARILAQSEELETPVDSVETEAPFDDGTRRLAPQAMNRNIATPDEKVVAFRLPLEHESGLVNPDITLDESQAEAVLQLANKQYGCLIGAAGTGKTTVQKYLIKNLIYDNSNDFRVDTDDRGVTNIACVAFTGMAVQVMKRNLPEWMHRNCKTIHSLLEFEPVESMNPKTGKATRVFEPQRHRMNKLNVDAIIIDESSMLGLELWIQLIDALKDGTRVYMTGDLNQLPPIVGQPVFAYALSEWHVCELTKVHRQKEAGANRIVEVAHEVLNGVVSPTFDVLKNNKNWRVHFHRIADSPDRASKEIINILNALRTRPIDPDDPNSPMLYDPHADRVMTAGNGYDTTSTSSMVQQAPLNERLAYLIDPPTPENPRLKIDAGRAERIFSVGNRVMSTKNESPNKPDRVTNGQAGTITMIIRNGDYAGDPRLYGPEDEIKAYQTEVLVRASLNQDGPAMDLSSLSDMSFDEADMDDMKEGAESDDADSSDSSGVASHSVTVRFDNGAVRTYKSKAQVESIQLAYCSTVAKCQGSQFDTAIIICHHTEKNQLCREWLYTAITRGAKRVMILGTDYAMRYAISRQRIKGRTLAEKIKRYQEMLRGEASYGYGSKLKVNVPLSIEDYNPMASKYEIIGGIGGA
jgi:ATP-dependent exoDNAse (exonuclease V) alpha subunit